MSRGYYIVKNQEEYEELIKTPRKEFRYDKIKILVAKRNKKMRELLENRCYFNGDKKIEGKEYLEFHYFLRKYTYLYLSNKEDSQIARQIFEKRGNWRPYNPKKDKNKVDFMFTDNKYLTEERLYKIKSLLKNFTSQAKYSNIGNKNLLYKELEKIPSARKYLVFNYSVDSSSIDYKKIEKLFQKYKVMIFKPIGGFAGSGIEVFDDFDNFFKYCQSNKSFSKYRNWVLQEYIINPMLIDGKKFHIRGYYLVHQNKKYLMDEGEIWYTKKDFVLRNFEDSDIHGLKYNQFLIKNPLSVKIYPEDLDVNEKIKEVIREQFEHLFHLVGKIDKYFKCFPESKDCYQVLGFDVMITENYQVKLIEINSGPGIPSLNVPYSKELFENQIKLMVDTTFPPKNKVDEDSGFKLVY